MEWSVTIINYYLIFVLVDMILLVLVAVAEIALCKVLYHCINQNHSLLSFR